MPFKLFFGNPIKVAAAIPIVVFAMGYLRDQPVILPIDVPKEFRDVGYTEPVVAKRLMDQMSIISRSAGDYVSERLDRAIALGLVSGSSRIFGAGLRTAGDPSGVGVKTETPDIRIPGTETSLDLIATQIRSVLGWQRAEIAGEITKTGNHMELRVRFASWSASYPETVAAHADAEDLGRAIDRLLARAAKDLMAEVHPHVAAAAYLEDKAYDRAAEMIARALDKEFVDGDLSPDHALTYFLWAQLDIEQQGTTPVALQQAEWKYRMALTIRPDMPELCLALANVLRKTNRNEEADELYRQAYVILSKRAPASGNSVHSGTDESAQVALGLLSESYGRVFDADQRYRLAAERGYAEAQFLLARLYERGSSGPPGRTSQAGAHDQAIYWYRQAAEQGHVDAQFRLARLYDSGWSGQEEDNALAVYWYRQAAEKGLAAAQNNLGVMYRNGEGIAPDERQAALWFDQAAKQGESTGMLNLAMMYLEGRGGLPKDARTAEDWLRKAANLNNARASHQLAWLLADQGRNLVEALGFARIAVAAEPGNGAYRDVLGWILYLAGRYPDAVDELRKAVQPGEWLRYDHLGDAYDKLNCRGHAHAAWFDALEAAQRKEQDALKNSDMRAARRMHTQSVRLQAKLTKIAPAAGKPSVATSSTVPSPCPI